MNEFRAIAGADSVWANQTILHPAGFAAVFIFGFALLLLPRRYALLPLVMMCCLVAPAQRVSVLTLDFNLLRIMMLFGWLRIILRGELLRMRPVTLDWLVIAWVMAGTVVYTVQQASTSALVFKLGASYDAIGLYFLSRCLIREFNDFKVLACGLAALAVPVAMVFLLEKLVGRNMFAFLGGVPEITIVRQGKLRAQGPFPHAIMAGVFWAVLLPIISSIWWFQASKRWLAGIGVACGLIIVVATASSTPIAAIVAAGGAAAMYPLRHRLSLIRWSALACVLILHLLMAKPVWHLIARVDLVGGSTGWHRYKLIDAWIQRIPEWALLGTRTTAHWGRGLQDVTNQYVMEGVRGGFITFALFIAILWMSFALVGRLLRANSVEPAQRQISWALGVALFVNVVSFLSVSYFGQTIVVLYIVIAAIASLSAIPMRRPQRIMRKRQVTAPSGHLPRPLLAK